MATRKYALLADYIKKKIQTNEYPLRSYLPSEHDFCHQFNTTRTTVRRALQELIKEGFIQKEHGKGSKVLEREKTLGLPTIKGFSGATDYPIKTRVTERPTVKPWDSLFPFTLNADEKDGECVWFQRVRYIRNKPVILENNWYSTSYLEPVNTDEFIDGSFFKTLSKRYFIEIMGTQQELKAIAANAAVAHSLGIAKGAPVLYIKVKFKTSVPELTLYGELYCNTEEYPMRNSYFL